MNFRKTQIAAAAAWLTLSAHAQSPADNSAELNKVEVTGVRASLEKSLSTKRNAEANIEVVTAEDVGKMPDKNIADSLSRLTGVSVTYGSAGAFDEAERVQIRGTPTFLNMVTINGHSLSSGDWYLSDQQFATRAVGFGLLPSELISRAVVTKNGTAEVMEGGAGGNIDIVTRKPLDFGKPLTVEASAGAVYSDLAAKAKPQLNVLANWKNETNTFGAMVQMFQHERALRRDGIETIQNNTISSAWRAASPTSCFTYQGAQLCGDGALAGKRMVTFPNTGIFEGQRVRQGGTIAMQWRPTKDLELGYTGFKSSLNADNAIANVNGRTSGLLANNGALIKDPVFDGDVVVSGTLVPYPANGTGANYAATGNVTAANPYGAQSAQISNQVRKGAVSSSGFQDVDFKFKLNERLTLTGLVGSTEGTGDTNEVPGILLRAYNTGMSWQLNGKDPFTWQLLQRDPNAANYTLRPLDLNNFKNDFFLTYAGQLQGVFKTRDQERYGFLNGVLDVDAGPFSKLKFGIRQSNHENTKDAIDGSWDAVDRMTAGFNATPGAAQMFFCQAAKVNNVAGTSTQYCRNNGLPYTGAETAVNTPVAQAYVNGLYPPSSWPLAGATGLPSNFGTGLANSVPVNIPYMNMDEVVKFGNALGNWDPVLNKRWNNSWILKEKNTSAFISGDFEYQKLSGTVGVRAVHTDLEVTKYVGANTIGALASTTADRIVGCPALSTGCVVTQANPQAITSSRYDVYVPQVNTVSHDNVLPSLNLRLEVAPGVLMRASRAHTMSRPEYAQLAQPIGGFSDVNKTASGGNPNLKPITSNNSDVSLSWFFAPRGYVQFGVFEQRLNNYVKAGGSTDVELTNPTSLITDIYKVTSFQGKTATINGAEFGMAIPIGGGFGVEANATWLQGEDEDGAPMVQVSNKTFNLKGYYENDKLTVTAAYNFRSKYPYLFSTNALTGTSVSNWSDSQDSLSASVSYKFNKNLSLSLDGNNLLNPTYYYYQTTENIPSVGWFKNGRQFYLNLRMKY